MIFFIFLCQLIFMLFATTAITFAISAGVISYIDDREDGIVHKVWNTGWAGQIVFIVTATILSILIFT